MARLLDNRVALITGAGRGLGRGIAKVFADEGAAVAVGDILVEAVNETAKMINERGGRAIPLSMDVTSVESIQAAINQTVDHYGKVDILVNNAGMVRLDDPLELSKENFNRTLHVNLTGTFLCSQAFAKKVRDLNLKGNIVNIASSAGKVGFQGQIDYNVAKAGVINLTRMQAVEMASLGINVNAVCPGAVETEMLLDCANWICERSGGDPYQLVQTFAPPQLGRLIQPEEVGYIVAFLASEKAAIIRGQSINVDAGATPY